eukprot:12934994-Prorocentrum_lima.AAC.1
MFWLTPAWPGSTLCPRRHPGSCAGCVMHTEPRAELKRRRSGGSCRLGWLLRFKRLAGTPAIM